MKSEIGIILEQLTTGRNIEKIDEATLLQQNKNICSKIQRAVEKAIYQTRDVITQGQIQFLFNEDYYKLPLVVDFNISYKSLTWQYGKNSLLYLLAEPYMVYKDYYQPNGRNKNDLIKILKDYFRDYYIDLDIDRICKEAKCTTQEFNKDIGNTGVNTKGPVESYFVIKVQKALDTLLNPNIIKVTSSFKSEIKGGNKIPLLMYSPEQKDRVSYAIPGSGKYLFGRNTSLEDLLRDLQTDPLNFILDIPIISWVSCEIDEPRILSKKVYI